MVSRSTFTLCFGTFLTLRSWWHARQFVSLWKFWIHVSISFKLLILLIIIALLWSLFTFLSQCDEQSLCVGIAPRKSMRAHGICLSSVFPIFDENIVVMFKTHRWVQYITRILAIILWFVSMFFHRGWFLIYNRTNRFINIFFYLRIWSWWFPWWWWCLQLRLQTYSTTKAWKIHAEWKCLHQVSVFVSLVTLALDLFFVIFWIYNIEQTNGGTGASRHTAGSGGNGWGSIPRFQCYGQTFTRLW